MKSYEQLDREIFHICRKAEKQCKPTYSGKYKWSPAFAKAIKTLVYWKAQKKYGNTQNGLIRKLGKDADILFEYQTEDKIYHNINTSHETLKQIQEKDVQYRRDHLEELRMEIL